MDDVQLFLYKVKGQIIEKDNKMTITTVLNAVFAFLSAISILFIIYRLFVFYGVLLFSKESNIILYQFLLLIGSIILLIAVSFLSGKIEHIKWKNDTYQIIEAKNNVKIDETGITYQDKHYIYPGSWDIATSFPNITSIESECDFPILKYRTKFNNKINWVEVKITKNEYEEYYQRKLNGNFLEETQGSIISDYYIINQLYQEIKRTATEKLKTFLYILSAVFVFLSLNAIVLTVLRLIIMREFDGITNTLLMLIPAFILLSAMSIFAVTNLSKLSSKYYFLIFGPIAKKYHAKIDKTSIIYNDIHYIFPEFWVANQDHDEYKISYKLDEGKIFKTIIVQVSEKQYERLNHKQGMNYLLKVNS